MEESPTSRRGSATAAEIYLSVGIALSWWEASEDMLQNLFEAICAGKEQVARETFSIAPRASRHKMILSALGAYSKQVLPDEASSIKDALKKLDKLAPMRNEIAHGYVSNTSTKIDDHITMEGNFLVSTITPSGEFAIRSLNFKYAHTAREIDEWCGKVRHQRGIVMDCWVEILTRNNRLSYGT